MEIVLIRHGKPEGAVNPRLCAPGYRQWIKNYDRSKVVAHSRPAAALKSQLRLHHLVSSDLIRAVDSTLICMGQEPAQQLPILREMAIPHYPLPVRLKAWTWLYLSRVFWTLGIPCSSESFSQARQRAREGASELIRLAEHHGKVAVFCHGYMNFFLRRALVRHGWQLHQKSNHYWGVSRLTLT